MSVDTNAVLPGRNTTPAARDQRRRPAPSRRPRARRQVLPYLLLAPAVLAILALLGYPVVTVVITSFQQLDLGQLVRHETVWVGFANYREILSDPDFWTITVRTLVFTAACVASIVLGGLVTAQLMRHAGKVVRMIMQIALLLAWAMPVISATTVFQWIFDQNYGILNKTLVALGLHGFTGYDWFSTGPSTLTIIVILLAWQGIPFAAFTIYAGLLTIPADLYEAASIDGAKPRQAFGAVTWPALKPIVMITVFLEILWDFKVLTQVWVIRNGGPDGGSTTLSVLQYLDGISGHHYGVAAAVSVLMILIIIAVTAQYIRLLVRAQEVEI
ncbi:MAG TPA: sugar ABC transporter permease [Pseudonocardiaceae bacterium]|jgi:N,N'-diacetylchitobiose transport system permease protein|nr:sugar ABC transporter permease [Pseudonocardiaceae bacterium]